MKNKLATSNQRFEDRSTIGCSNTNSMCNYLRQFTLWLRDFLYLWGAQHHCHRQAGSETDLLNSSQFFSSLSPCFWTSMGHIHSMLFNISSTQTVWSKDNNFQHNMPEIPHLRMEWHWSLHYKKRPILSMQMAAQPFIQMQMLLTKHETSTYWLGTNRGITVNWAYVKKEELKSGDETYPHIVPYVIKAGRKIATRNPSKFSYSQHVIQHIQYSNSMI
jgi:hypothetical protein